MDSLELEIIMPVYNEDEVIAAVIDKWTNMLDQLQVHYCMRVYNDGSKDSTAEVLNAGLARWPHVRIFNKQNRGHGPTILQGYRECCKAPWIFQTDSDDEMQPDDFIQLWNQRDQYDFLIGRRENRMSPLPRKIISAVSRLSVRSLYGQGVYDVNSPFRLMRRAIFENCFNTLSEDSFAPNVIISGYAGMKRVRIKEVLIAHTKRQTGTVSIKKWKLLKAAVKSLMQTVAYRKRVKRD